MMTAGPSSHGIVVNLWFIKHSNGLFHYGLDYAEALGGAVREVWVRDTSLVGAVRQRLPAATIRVLSAYRLPGAWIGVRRRRDMLFTPSPHPLPFVARQVVVVHDSFPFQGRAGEAKRALLRAGLRWSGATAGFINRADAHAFLSRLGVPEARLSYLPNRLSSPAQGRVAVSRPGSRVVVGLFGTDSPKKNYDALFAAASDGSFAGAQVVWRILGHANDYTARLRAAYPSQKIEVIESDATTMEAFVESINLAVSVAQGEGFARPVALSLMRGVPTLLLDTPVFREFYAGSAPLLATPRELVGQIAAIAGGETPAMSRPCLLGEQELRGDFARAVAWLQGAAA